MGAKAARPCACARTSTAMCVGGRVRRAAVGSDGGLCDGGSGWQHDGGVPGWDGDEDVINASFCGTVFLCSPVL